MSYKIEVAGISHGLKFAVLGTSMGHRCGYVGIPLEHPPHGCAGNKPRPLPKFSGDEEIGDRGIIPLLCRNEKAIGEIPDCFFDVHGGITYSKSGKTGYPLSTPNDYWWFGFDCAHCHDTCDPELMAETTKRIMSRAYYGGHIWTTQEVVEQCDKLAAQLAAVWKANV